MSKSILLVAGEVSGDMHGADLVKALRSQDENLSFLGLGGDAMQRQDVKLLEHTNQLSVMGFSEVIFKIFFFKKLIRRIKKIVNEEQPMAIILIDYPGFNLRLAKKLNKSSVPIYYYIPPKLWAWKKNRIKYLRKYIKKLFVIFPFEYDFYKKQNLNVEYAGNPLVQQISNLEEKEIIWNAEYKVALLPGSRLQEIKNILPIMLDVTEKLIKHNISYIIAAPNKHIANEISKYPQAKDLRLIIDDTLSVVKHADVAIITSGTATLEAALLDTPHLLVYRTSRITFWLAKKFLKLKYIGLVNIILQKIACIELIQNQLTSENLSKELEKLLLHKENKEKMSIEFRKLRELLGSQLSSDIIAKSILESNHLN